MYGCSGQELAWVSKCQNSSSACCIYTSPGTEGSRSCKLALSFQIYILFLHCIFFGGWEGVNLHVDVYSRKNMFYFFCQLIQNRASVLKRRLLVLEQLQVLTKTKGFFLHFYSVSISGSNTHKLGENNTNN